MSRQAGKRPGEDAARRNDATLRRLTRLVAAGKRICKTCESNLEISEIEEGQLFACPKCGPRLLLAEIEGHLYAIPPA